MEIRACGKGHYYSPDLYPECPECAMKAKVEVSFGLDDHQEPITARIAQCSAGHYYSAILKRCPVCSRNPIPPMAGMEATCANGHKYDRGRSLNCPTCGAPQKTYPMKNPRKEFADIESDNNTLLFTAFNGLGYWLRQDSGQMKLTARTLISRSGMVLENTLPVSMEDTMRAARKILDALKGAEKFLREPDCDTGDSRFLFNTRQLNCDHRWQEKPSLTCTDATFYMRQVQKILGELYAKASPSHGFTPEDGWKLHARLGYCNMDLKLYRTDVAYELVLEELIYYHFTDSLTLFDSVKIPLSIGEEILSWLEDCGVMEALMGKNKRPGDGIHRDPAMATIFYLNRRDLTFDYRDWDKMNQGAETDALNNAQRKLLEWFQEAPMYCNPI